MTAAAAKPPLKGRDPKGQLAAAVKTARSAKAKANREKLQGAFAEAWRRFAEPRGLPLPRPEFRFHKTRRWRFDFAWPWLKFAEGHPQAGKRLMLAVEIQGGTAIGRGKATAGKIGGHNSMQGMKEDADKANAAALAGWTLLHFTDQHDAETMVRTVAEAMGVRE